MINVSFPFFLMPYLSNELSGTALSVTSLEHTAWALQGLLSRGTKLACKIALQQFENNFMDRPRVDGLCTETRTKVKLSL
jgi:hypothetical protein